MKVSNKIKKHILKINKEYCKGCKLCVVSCPQKILIMSDKINKLGYEYVEVIDKEKCTGCGSCYLMCPDYLIEIYKES
ncbi:MAG: 4Fe-4S binding protein [Endomicrobia bacterium]|nr:4Fe-4S binding protein [Endomicrobiia bacterium]